MRCVFDTNVLVSALLLPDSRPRQALHLALRKGKVLLSFGVLGELYEVLSRKQFRRYVDEEDIRIFLAALTRLAQWVDVDVQVAASGRSDSCSSFIFGIVASRLPTLTLSPLEMLSSSPPRRAQGKRGGRNVD